jgi:hypothetical protein
MAIANPPGMQLLLVQPLLTGFQSKGKRYILASDVTGLKMRCIMEDAVFLTIAGTYIPCDTPVLGITEFTTNDANPKFRHSETKEIQKDIVVVKAQFVHPANVTAASHFKPMRLLTLADLHDPLTNDAHSRKAEAATLSQPFVLLANGKSQTAASTTSPPQTPPRDGLLFSQQFCTTLTGVDLNGCNVRISIFQSASAAGEWSSAEAAWVDHQWAMVFVSGVNREIYGGKLKKHGHDTVTVTLGLASTPWLIAPVLQRQLPTWMPPTATAAAPAAPAAPPPPAVAAAAATTAPVASEPSWEGLL